MASHSRWKEHYGHRYRSERLASTTDYRQLVLAEKENEGGRSEGWMR